MRKYVMGAVASVAVVCSSSLVVSCGVTTQEKQGGDMLNEATGASRSTATRNGPEGSYGHAHMAAQEVFDAQPEVHSLVAGVIVGGMSSGSVKLGAFDSTGQRVEVADREQLKQVGQFAENEAKRDGRSKAVELAMHRDGRWRLIETDEKLQRLEVRSVAELANPREPLRAELGEIQRLHEIWTAHAGGIVANQPATEAELEELRSVVKVEIPEVLEGLLKLSNGTDFYDTDEDRVDFAGGWPLMSTQEIIDVYKNYNLEPAPNNFIQDAQGGLTQQTQWHTSWIPFAQDVSGDFFALDLAPGPNRSIGQVLEYGNDFSTGAWVRAHSINDFFSGQMLQDYVAPEHSETLIVQGDGAIEGEGIKQVTVQGDPASQGDHAPQSRDLSGIEQMPVQILNLRDTNNVDLTALEGHPDLRRLAFAGKNSIRTPDVLTKLPNLREVRFESVPSDELLSAIKSNPNLHSVEFGDDLTLSQVLQLKKKLTGDIGAATIKEGTAQEG